MSSHILPKDYHIKQKALEHVLEGFTDVVVAVSGGVDSRLLTHMLVRCNVNVRALHITGPHLSEQESAYAQQWLAEQNIPCTVLNVSPLTSANVCLNDNTRCYHCKHLMFTAILKHAGPNAVVLEGSNASDKKVYRPGQQALHELGIRSPLAEAGLTKNDIRALAAATGMEAPQQPSRPCLLTRFGYGYTPTEPLLDQVGKCEDNLFLLGLQAFRLRLPEEHTAVLFIDRTEQEFAKNNQQKIQKTLTECGFPHVSILYTDSISGLYDRQSGLTPPS